MSGTGARVIPWLQDFSLGVDYGPAEVRAQIDGAADAGMDDFLLWDPAVTYTAGALAGDAPLPTTGVAKPGKASEELVTLPSTSGSAEAEPAKQAAPAAEEEGPVDSGLEPNELGMVPVLMYHQVVPDGGSEYDLTPAEFRAELERLYEEHYRPITAADLVNGTIDVPKGTTPVVLTFDDSTASQAVLRDDGTIDPDTAVGIMLEFAESHPGFRPAATFYLNGGPFAAGEKTGELLRWLVANGFELGNHTRDHANFSEVSERRRCSASSCSRTGIIREQVPDLKIGHDGAAVRRHARPAAARAQGLLGRGVLRVQGRDARRRRARAVPVLQRVRRGGDPPHPLRARSLGRARLRLLARHARRQPGAALRLRRRPGHGRVPGGPAGRAREALRRSCEAVLSRPAQPFVSLRSSLLISFAVFAPTRPSAFSFCFFWNLTTAFFVFEPQMPSASPTL